MTLPESLRQPLNGANIFEPQNANIQTGNTPFGHTAQGVIFSLFHIESIICRNQDKSINNPNTQGKSTVFIEFMLNVIEKTLKEALNDDVGTNAGLNVGINLEERVYSEIKRDSQITIKLLAAKLSTSTRQIERTLAKLKKDRKIERIGSNKSGSWKCIE